MQDWQLIGSIEIPGTIESFRAVMERLARHSAGCWTSESGGSLHFQEWRTDETSSARSSWYVWIPASPDDVLAIQDERGWHEIEQIHEGDGCIQAYQHPSGSVQVDFWDQAPLTSPYRRPIGRLFVEFCSMVSEALQSSQVPRKNKVGRRRGLNIDTAPKVAKARLIMERKGKQQYVACELASVAPKTLRRHRDHPDVLSAMELLLEDREFLDYLEGI